MKNLILIITLIVSACSNQKVGNNEKETFELQYTHTELSNVFPPILNMKVGGYVVISYNDLNNHDFIVEIV